MTSYEVLFDPKWDGWFSRLDGSMKKRVMKKILQLQGENPSCHLKQGVPYYVAEIGQHRLCYKIDRERKAKILCFVGDHKEYEKWLGI
jgi:mRNA-degrading endonuclease RelE of RelBE toxin-antitoxin system